MSLLVVEIVLALVALRLGWRIAPLLLVALPIAALAFASAAAPLLAPWVEPAGVANFLAHGLSLVGLGVACWTRPAERPAASRMPGRPASRRTRSLYQI